MANSALRPGESYEVGTRRKYQSEDVAQTYHAEFNSLSLSPNDVFVRLVTRGERNAISRLLHEISGEVHSATDIPCGTGKLLRMLSERRLDVVAGDVSLEMMSIARTDHESVAGQRSFVQLDATQLPLRSRSVDVALCLRLLHRVPTNVKGAILGELYRISARFAIVSFGLSSPWQRFRTRVRQVLTGRRTVPYALTTGAMNELLLENGWCVRRKLGVLPVLSAEVVLLLEKR